MFANPAGTLQELRHLGVGMVRIEVRWSLWAPRPTSRVPPNFNPTDPSAYPASDWTVLDQIVLDAAADGIQVMMVPSAWAPYWAQGPNPGRYGAHYDIRYSWEPSPSQFGQFVTALATRYSGSYIPPGSSSPLPHVGTWEIYNEPNFGLSLAPQAIDHSQLPYGPKMYRALVDAAWSALQGTGHRGDTVLIGALGADGSQRPGTYGEMKPLIFVRELYCLNSSYQRYLGRAASLRGCPTTRAGYSRFRSQHPVLFRASGFSDHPYVLPKGMPPTRSSSPDPNYAEFSQLPHLATTLNRVLRTYGSFQHFPIWNTEYGYITCPPNCTAGRYVSPATAAKYLNWAEYISWRNSRIANTMQYQLYDPNPTVGVTEKGGFASGLVSFKGAPKPTYYAYRMPIFLPNTRTSPGRSLEVWGDVRPAPYAVSDGDGAQFVQIQFARAGSGTWTTLETLQVTNPRGYIDTRITFPGSGSVRLAWTYPPHDQALVSNFVTNSNGLITSRTVGVTITRKGARRDRRR
jgi:hypothetical protein